MKTIIDFLNRKRISRIFLLCSFIVCLFWIIAYTVNIYAFAITGAVYEILWLPMLLFIFLVPVVAVFMWVMQKFSFRSHYLYALLLVVSMILWFEFRS